MRTGQQVTTTHLLEIGVSSVCPRISPVNLEKLGRHLVSFATTTGRPIWIVPRLMDVTPPMNVMRGEETQVLGALFSESSETQEEGRLFCLPGTHFAIWPRRPQA